MEVKCTCVLVPGRCDLTDFLTFPHVVEARFSTLKKRPNFPIPHLERTSVTNGPEYNSKKKVKKRKKKTNGQKTIHCYYKIAQFMSWQAPYSP